MPEDSFQLAENKTVTMTGLDASRLIERGDGDAALLYIYIINNGGRFSRKDASSALKMTETRLNGALAVLAEIGLLSRTETPATEKRLRDPEVLPHYDDKVILAAAREDRAFSQLLGEVSATLGKTLSSSDMLKLFGIYDHLGLPPEVILTLVAYYMEEYRRRYGEGRLPTMRFIESVAYTWEREGIVTLQAAEDYMRRNIERNSVLSEMRKELGLWQRQPTMTERKYLERWADMGHSPDAVALAYDRTVGQTGRLSWQYMDKILTSWHDLGLHTAAEAERGDKRPDKKPAVRNTGEKQVKPDAKELQRMKQALEEIKKG